MPLSASALPKAAPGVGVPRHSRYGLYCTLAFIFWTVLMRFVLPFGDEPDFTVRAVELVEEDGHPLWVPYYWMGGLLNELQVESACEPDASPISIWGHIDSGACTEPLEQIIIRVAVVLLCSAPLLWVIVYRRTLHRLLRVVGLRVEASELNERLDALGTTLLIPGMVYYLGLLSHEQFTLVVSLLISVVWGSWSLVLGLAAFTMSLDLGNGVIVFSFLALYVVIAVIWRLSGFKGVGIFLFGLATLAIVGGYELLNYVQLVPFLANKAEAIFVKSLTAGFLDKYPTALRPAITYITGIFMTPSGIKAVPVQLMFAAAITVGLWRLFSRLQRTTTVPSEADVSLTPRPSQIARATQLLPTIAALTTVLSFSLLLPDYANAKYYMFLAPFFARPLLMVYGRQSRLLFMNGCFIVVAIWLGLQYV